MPIKNAQMKITSGFDLNQNPINNSKEVTIFSTSGLKSLTLRTHTDGALRITDTDNNTVTLLDATLKVPSSLLSDASITLSKIGQSGATTEGQIVKWSGTAWVPGDTTISTTDGNTLATDTKTIRIMGAKLTEASGSSSFWVKELKSENVNSVKIGVIDDTTIRMENSTGGAAKIDFVVPASATANSVLFAGSSNVMNVTSLSSALATSIAGAAGQVLGWDVGASKWVPSNVPTTLTITPMENLGAGDVTITSLKFGNIGDFGHSYGFSLSYPTDGSSMHIKVLPSYAYSDYLGAGAFAFKNIALGDGIVASISPVVDEYTSLLSLDVVKYASGIGITGSVTYDELVIGSGLSGAISGTSPSKQLTLTNTVTPSSNSFSVTGNATGSATTLNLSNPFTGTFAPAGTLTLELTPNGIPLDRINKSTFAAGSTNAELTFLSRSSGVGGTLEFTKVIEMFDINTIGPSPALTNEMSFRPVGSAVLLYDSTVTGDQQATFAIKVIKGSTSADSRWLFFLSSMPGGPVDGGIAPETTFNAF